MKETYLSHPFCRLRHPKRKGCSSTKRRSRCHLSISRSAQRSRRWKNSAGGEDNAPQTVDATATRITSQILKIFQSEVAFQRIFSVQVKRLVSKRSVGASGRVSCQRLAEIDIADISRRRACPRCVSERAVPSLGHIAIGRADISTREEKLETLEDRKYKKSQVWYDDPGSYGYSEQQGSNTGINGESYRKVKGVTRCAFTLTHNQREASERFRKWW